MAITFMAKFDEREGSSCHIHLSLRDEDGTPLFADDQQAFDALPRRPARCMRELTLFFAPNVNSYKRFAEGSFAPTAVAWGADNRTCALRVRRPRARPRAIECRVPGADVNPYLALARADRRRPARRRRRSSSSSPRFDGNAYSSDQPRVPSTLRDARDLFAGSEVARAAFGDEVVDHYLNYARVELEAFDSAVTDWERERGFERL